MQQFQNSINKNELDKAEMLLDQMIAQGMSEEQSLNLIDQLESKRQKLEEKQTKIKKQTL